MTGDLAEISISSKIWGFNCALLAAAAAAAAVEARELCSD